MIFAGTRQRGDRKTLCSFSPSRESAAPRRASVEVQVAVAQGGDVELDALDQVGLAVEQPVLLEEGTHERLRLVEVRAGVRLRVKSLGSGLGLG